MILNVAWEHATRPPEVKTQVELTYRNALLEYFNGVEVAKRAHDRYACSPSKPFHDWPRAVWYARRAVKKVITAEELGHSRFRESFDND